jgi:Electron transfer flavoprotein, alpha subunit
MVLIYTEHSNGTFKKSAFEALSYGSKLAEQLKTSCMAIVLGEADVQPLAAYGAHKIVQVADARLNQLDAQAYTKAIGEIAEHYQASIVIFSSNNTAKAVAPRVAARMKAGFVSGAIALPDLSNGFVVKKSVFSGKAFAFVKVNSDKKVISIIPNSIGVEKSETNPEIIQHTITFSETDFAVKVTAVNKVTGVVPLGEAELVVSGGRGLKGPENWGILEELANSMGATLACSRPVADSHWRPHHEHVGQTGGTIRPNLYVAVGISGAIQHLAGVNSSKTIVVINKDPEAPFFKAADYGVLGDAFEIVPKLTQAIKKFKSSQNA